MRENVVEKKGTAQRQNKHGLLSRVSYLDHILYNHTA